MLRYIPNKDTGEEEEVDGEQQLAVKIFNRKKLKNSKTMVGLKMSSHFEMIQDEIKVWERVAHINVVKIFSLYNYDAVPDMYLLMEYCRYGQIQHTET